MQLTSDIPDVWNRTGTEDAARLNTKQAVSAAVRSTSGLPRKTRVRPREHHHFVDEGGASG